MIVVLFEHHSRQSYSRYLYKNITISFFMCSGCDALLSKSIWCLTNLKERTWTSHVDVTGKVHAKHANDGIVSFISSWGEYFGQNNLNEGDVCAFQVGVKKCSLIVTVHTIWTYSLNLLALWMQPRSKIVLYVLYVEINCELVGLRSTLYYIFSCHTCFS
jgi:hypothetical protein